MNELYDFFIQSSDITIINVDVTDILDLYINNTDNNEYFNFSELNYVTLKKAIMRTTFNSVGPNNVSIKAYKCTLPFVLPFITELFNKSLTIRIFPAECKFSHIVPIPKTTNAMNCSDYRPILLTSNLSKAL